MLADTPLREVPMPTPGKTLRRERRAKEITTVDLARQMGISRATLWTIEKSAEVDPGRVVDYRAAVKALSDANTEEAA